MWLRKIPRPMRAGSELFSSFGSQAVSQARPLALRPSITGGLPLSRRDLSNGFAVVSPPLDHGGAKVLSSGGRFCVLRRKNRHPIVSDSLWEPRGR